MRGGSAERERRQLQKAKERAQKKGDLKEEAAVCNQLGEVLACRGDFQEALQEHRQELRLLESVGDVIGCAVAHRKIGERLAELESYEAALKHQRRHLELARSVSSHIEQQRAWATIGRTYMFMADSDQSSNALQEAEGAFQKSLLIVEDTLEGTLLQREVNEMRTRLYLNLGLVYDSLKDPARRSFYIKKSIYLAGQTGLCEDLYRAYFNLGNIHLREGEYSKARRCLERARECGCKMKVKSMESECCASIAQLLLSLGDFVAAKRTLKKAYLLGSQQPQQRESIRQSLRYATKVSRLQQALEEAEAAGHLDVALGLCEQLGDLFSKAGDFQWSAEAYEKQLHHAQTLKRPEQELAVIHVSLAATFGDLKDHTRAQQHYRAELALRQGNPLEEGKTWLSIALSKEEAKESSEELDCSFQTALQYAEKAQDAKLQCQILRHFHASQERRRCPEAAETLGRLQDLCCSRGWGSDGGISEEEEEPEPQESGPLEEESDLELSDSEEEDDLEGYSKSVPGRRRVSKWNQRNDRGETLLHRACIDGNLHRVQFFIQNGHPLNPRDYCGWTPLHEACNHGHLEIVRLLLDHGAAIDDPGGPGCEGITPLHDALYCGHFAVAELLVQRGASVLLRTAKGLNPLGTLQEWVNLYGSDLDQETREHCKAMKHLLRKVMADRGSKSQAPQGRPASQLFDTESQTESCLLGTGVKPLSPRRAMRQDSEEGPGLSGAFRHLEDDCMLPLRAVKKRKLPRGEVLLEEEQTPLAPPAEYQKAMRSVGSAQSRLAPSPERMRPPEGPALIPPEQYVGDDWLEDDVGSHKRSRWRQEEGSGSGSESAEATGPDSDNRDPCQPLPAARKRRRRVQQSRLTQLIDRIPLGRTRGVSTVEGPEPSWAGGPDDFQGTEDSMGGASPHSALTQPPALPPRPPIPIRVRVKVQDNVFLIPVPHSGSERRPVSWLAEEAAQRYYQACGLLPRLTLKKEGALLAPHDLIVEVLQSNEEVLAEVQSWDLPPLVERYRRACRSLAVGEHRLILKMLERQELGSSVSVSGVALRCRQLTSLLRALKLQTSVQQLCLSGTGLADDSAEELLATSRTMPKLKLLNLSANHLGPEGMRKLAEGLSGTVAFQNLEELDLSFNPLGDSCCQSLAWLVQACPVLSTLRLRACGLTMAFLQPYRLLLASALKGTGHMKQLAMSHNALGSQGLDLLLRSLPCDTLTHLEIGSVGVRSEEQQPLCDAVVSYLAQDGCSLTHLTFSGNRLNDDSVAELARCLPICQSLVWLDLSANPEIGLLGVRTLLLALEERSQGLQFLNLAGCAVKGPLDSLTWSKLSANVRELRLCSQHLSSSDQQDVAQLWPSPPGTSLCSLARQRKLFCQRL